MRLRYNANQEHQLRAIDAVLGVFDGQPYSMPRRAFADNKELIPLVSANNELKLNDEQLLANLQAVQKRHNETATSPIETDASLLKITQCFESSEDNGMLKDTEVSFPNFSVEMETGTGKTYVFLRTIRELAGKFGFLKFIIVAPSIAVRENILHALRVTATHFAEIYKSPCGFMRYDSSKLGKVRTFATTSHPQIMVITMDSFRKQMTVIRRSAESLSGDMPLHLLQATRPILILDEPQNMATDLARESLARFNPLFALRYSATHREPYNLVHRLSPADAYNRGLVKKIQVGEVLSQNAAMSFVRVGQISHNSDRVLQAKITVNAHHRDGSIAPKTRTLRCHSNLGDIARLPEYRMLHIDDIDIGEKIVRLSDGRVVSEGEEVGGYGEDILRGQIKMTIDEHLKRQQNLRRRGIKVLSLFFIDRVENYLPNDGKIRRIFEECFDEIKTRYDEWRDVPAHEVHNGYFAKSKKGDTENDVKSFDLIMRDKESLLTFAADNDEEETRRRRRVAFIFSHSALREGWDNPNIMQICKLRQGNSEMRRRQEVGRGLRLAVNQRGERVQDEDANLLTVIAAESYADYARDYQNEITEEFRHAIEAKFGKRLEDLTEQEREELAGIHGEGFLPPLPRRLVSQKAYATKLIRASRADGEVKIDPEFRKLWEHISPKTAYRIQFDSGKLIDAVVLRLKEETIAPPTVQFQMGRIEVDEDGVFDAVPATGVRTLAILQNRLPLPDYVSLIAHLLLNGSPPLQLTRNTLTEIVRQTANDGMIQNPLGYAAAAARIVREEMGTLMTDGVEYEKINNAFYDWEQHFVDAEHEIASSIVADMKGRDKTPYSLISCDSEVEKKFAEALRERDDIKMFLKLPKRFVVPTPVGSYNPDWAVLMTDADGGEHLYFVAETKHAVNQDGAVQWENLRGSEGKKIKYAPRHFGSKQFNKKGALDGVDYQVVRKHEELKRRN